MVPVIQKPVACASRTFLFYLSHLWFTLLRHDQGVEAKAKGYDEDGEDHGELDEGLEDVEEHDDVDAKEGQLPDVAQEVEPGEHQGYGSHLPLPTLNN